MRKEYDFSRARKAGDVPHLARLQAQSRGKTRITIMLDNDMLEDRQRVVLSCVKRKLNFLLPVQRKK
ncbi:MAG: hypothetical protein OXE42_05920 [Gammaproteobacteria bacterium]|nr:hypothetical protein [Gammaproteobacteria bacterium]